MAAATLLQGQTDAKDPIFIGKVGVALEEKCETVLLEAATVPGHAARFAYALNIVNNDPIAMATRLSWALVAAGIPATATDTQIRAFFSDANFNILSGISL